MRQSGRCKGQHGSQRLQRREAAKQWTEGLAYPGKFQRRAKARRIWQHEGQNIADQPVHQRAAVGVFHMHTSIVDQVHVVHARGAGGGAGKTGQAAIQMLDDVRIGGATVFQHILDEVDASARTIQFVTQRHIGGTGRRAEAAMHAAAQNGLGFCHMRIGKLLGGEIGLHRSASCHLARVENAGWIHLALDPRLKRKNRCGQGLKRVFCALMSTLARTSVA